MQWSKRVSHSSVQVASLIAVEVRGFRLTGRRRLISQGRWDETELSALLTFSMPAAAILPRSSRSQCCGSRTPGCGPSAKSNAGPRPLCAARLRAPNHHTYHAVQGRTIAGAASPRSVKETKMIVHSAMCRPSASRSRPRWGVRLRSSAHSNSTTQAEPADSGFVEEMQVTVMSVTIAEDHYAVGAAIEAGGKARAQRPYTRDRVEDRCRKPSHGRTAARTGNHPRPAARVRRGARPRSKPSVLTVTPSMDSGTSEA